MFKLMLAFSILTAIFLPQPSRSTFPTICFKERHNRLGIFSNPVTQQITVYDFRRTTLGHLIQTNGALLIFSVSVSGMRWIFSFWIQCRDMLGFLDPQPS
jgi:hypothetical protein